MITVTGMTSRQTEASEAALIPLLLGKRGCNVTFVVDGSENMRAVLGSAKRLLIRTLLTKASLGDSLFNIMTFSGKVRRGSDNRETLPHGKSFGPQKTKIQCLLLHSSILRAVPEQFLWCGSTHLCTGGFNMYL